MVAVLFDLEGTLIQTKGEDPSATFEFRRQTKRKLIDLGIPPSILEGIERSTIMRNRASQYVEENFSEADTEKFRLEIEKFLEQYELDAAENSKLFSETISTLEKLKELGIKMGLVTGTSRKAVNTAFRLHGLKKYFDVIVTRENVKKLKPDPEGVLLAIKKLGAKDFFMIGDSVNDASAAKNAGGTSIIIKRTPTKKLSFHADYVAQSLNEVPIIIQATCAPERRTRYESRL